MTELTPSKKRTVALIILDGWGFRPEVAYNAIAEADTPFWDHLWQTFPHGFLAASESSVGLPDGQMGNSEVGHMTIGAGRVIDTDLVRITKAIQNGDLAKNPCIVELFNHVLKHDSMLHLQGLVSPGGVHSHIDHLYGMLRAAKAAGIKKVSIHAFTDGRDTPPNAAHQYLEDLERVIAEVGIGQIASISGRFFAMDRDKHWERLAKVEEVMFNGKGVCVPQKEIANYVRGLYEKGMEDEYIEPMVCLDHSGNACTIQKNDGILFFNFRSDRARMLTKKILAIAPEQNIFFATMTEYDRNFTCPVVFKPVSLTTTLAEEISRAGLTQAHIAETEKYAHATYFLNGGREKPHAGETHILVESRKDVATHDLAPEMRAAEIAAKAVEEIGRGTDFIFINFANADMVGHTGNRPAIIKAVEAVDRALKTVIDALLDKGGVALITADHGNAELNVDPESGGKHTSHTKNVVPAVSTDASVTMREGGLADVAPTILKLIGLPKPDAMTGTDLLS